MTTKTTTPNKTVAVLGYGSQGRAQALNLRDSGWQVYVGLREGGKSWKQAKEDGFEPCGFSQATKSADLVSVLLPDMVHTKVYENHVILNN